MLSNFKHIIKTVKEHKIIKYFNLKKNKAKIVFDFTILLFCVFFFYLCLLWYKLQTYFVNFNTCYIYHIHTLFYLSYYNFFSDFFY